MSVTAGPALTAQEVARLRAETPGAAGRIHLNNAGASLTPAPVLRAMKEHLDLEAELGGYEAEDARRAKADAAYEAVARLLGCAPRNVALVGSATAAFVQALSSFDFAPGDVIVTTKADYTSYQIALLSLARRTGVTAVHAADLPGGGVNPDSVRDLARHPRCRLVTVSWVPTHSGLVQDVFGVGAVCAELGVPYHVDACQAVGQIPIDVSLLKCDYLSATARKFLRGPRGMGFLYASDAVLQRGEHPLLLDMRAATWVAPDRYEIAPTARRFEDWEFSWALVLGLGAAARYALEVGVDRLGARASALAARLRERLLALPGARVLDRGEKRCAIVTADFAGKDATDLVTALRARGINTSASLGWYALLDLPERGVKAALRFSPHAYNTEAELDAAVAALRELL